MHIGQRQALDGDDCRQETQEQEFSSGLRAVFKEQASTNQSKKAYFNKFALERNFFSVHPNVPQTYIHIIYLIKFHA